MTSQIRIRRLPGSVSLFGPADPEIRLSQALPDPAPGYQARFGRSRWHVLGDFSEEDEDVSRLRHRFTSASIERNGEVIGGVKIVEYDIPLISIGWFWEAMDAHSSTTHELSEVLLSAWPDFPFDVACYGSVLELNRLWVEPGQRTSGVWIPVVHELFRRVRRQTATIIAKAYPLEYEGKLPDGAPERSAFERRRRAMIRYYARHLGLRPLPGPSGEEGWIWKSPERLEDIIEARVFDRNWRKEI